MKIVSAAADGTVWALSQQGEIFTRDDVQWIRLRAETDVHASTISVGSKSAIWAVDDQGTAYRWTGRNWVAMDPNTKLQSISVGEDGSCWASMSRSVLLFASFFYT